MRQDDMSSLIDLLVFLTQSWCGNGHLHAFACLQEASREAAPPTEEPSSGQRPGSSCPWQRIMNEHERTFLQHPFRESGPDANSRSPEAPGCFGDFWTVSLDFDWVWFFCSWGFKFSILLLQQSVRMFVMLLLALPLDSVLGTHRWIDWFFD